MIAMTQHPRWLIVLATVGALVMTGCTRSKRTRSRLPPSPRASVQPGPSAAPVDAAVADTGPAALDGVRVGVVKTGPEPWELDLLVGRGIPALSVDGKLFVRAGNGNAGANMSPGLNLDLVDVATNKLVKRLMVVGNLEEPPELAVAQQAAQVANDELARIQWLPMRRISAACMDDGSCTATEPYVFTIDTPALAGTLTWKDPDLTWKPTAPGSKPFASKPKWNPKPYPAGPDLGMCSHSAEARELHVAEGARTVLVDTFFMLTHACEGAEGTTHAVTLP